MNVTSTIDEEARTLTVTAEFDATPEQVWDLWHDPRKLERWWGPPGYPATFVEFACEPGGRAAYYMTGPDGTRYHGWWTITDVDAPRTLAFRDGFADADGNPSPDMPEGTAEISIEPLSDTQTRMTIVSAWESSEAMRQVLAMGMVEGLTAALGQIPAILADG